MRFLRGFGLEHRWHLNELEPGVRDRVAGLDEPVSWEDWPNVVERSRPRPRRIWRPAALGVTVAIAGSAVALLVSSIVAFGGGHGSSGTRPAFSSFALGAPPLGPGAIASETRLVATTQLRDGSHLLYVSPTRQGGFCYAWTRAGGGCGQPQTNPLSITWGRSRLIGTILSTQVSLIKIRFTDGTSAVPRIAWVSAPINAGFFLYEIPTGKTVADVYGFGRGGTRHQVTWFSV